jgi:hypothetical protein
VVLRRCQQLLRLDGGELRASSPDDPYADAAVARVPQLQISGAIRDAGRALTLVRPGYDPAVLDSGETVVGRNRACEPAEHLIVEGDGDDDAADRAGA